MVRCYHNTTRTRGAKLRQYEAAASTQELVIREFFERRGRAYTPSEIQRAVLSDSPLTSVRRAITNLTAAGVLVKLDAQRTGPYGRPEHQWQARAAAKPEQRGLFE